MSVWPTVFILKDTCATENHITIQTSWKASIEKQWHARAIMLELDICLHAFNMQKYSTTFFFKKRTSYFTGNFTGNNVYSYWGSVSHVLVILAAALACWLRHWHSFLSFLWWGSFPMTFASENGVFNILASLSEKAHACIYLYRISTLRFESSG